MIALASLTGSFVTLLAFLASFVACVSLARHPPVTFPKEGIWLSIIFACYFAVLAITTMLNGPDPTRFIEFVLISPFIYFIPLALILPARCTDISLKGVGRAAMIGTVPTALLALAFSEMAGASDRPGLATGNPNVLAALLLLQTFLCLAGWNDISRRERHLAFGCAAIGCVGLVFGADSIGASLAAGVLALISLLFWSGTQTRQIRRMTLSILFLVFLGSVFFVLPTIYGRIIGIMAEVADPEFGNWSTSHWTRLTLYRAAVLAIADNPWIGLGQHLRYEGVSPYYAVQPPDYAYYTHMHNLFLTHGTAAGIPGMLAALSLFISTLYMALRRAQPSMMVRWLGVTCASGLFLLGITETVLFHDLNTTFYMFLFVLVAVFSYQTREKPQDGRSV